LFTALGTVFSINRPFKRFIDAFFMRFISHFKNKNNGAPKDALYTSRYNWLRRICDFMNCIYHTANAYGRLPQKNTIPAAIACAPMQLSFPISTILLRKLALTERTKKRSLPKRRLRFFYKIEILKATD
jgi:hypothetical protein